MTFWQVSVSCKAHLAHLPIPVMVTFLPAPSSAAIEGITNASNSSPAIPVRRTIVFFIYALVGLMETVIRQPARNSVQSLHRHGKTIGHRMRENKGKPAGQKGGGARSARRGTPGF